MFPRILSRIREFIREKKYVMTIHAEEEMEEDELTVFDIESALLNGSIVVRQRDAATGEWKYIVKGLALNDEDVVYAVCKFGPAKKLVIITVYAEKR